MWASRSAPSRAKGLAFTVVLTLALGIGAHAAIFTLVRGVLLKPLVNRDENRLIYIRLSAPGADQSDAAFSVPEIQDLRAGVKTLSAIGDFSTIGFTMIGLGEAREVQADVVSGNYFDIVVLHPVLGLLTSRRRSPGQRRRRPHLPFLDRRSRQGSFCHRQNRSSR